MPNRKRFPDLKRFAAATIALGLLLSLSGCVYLRLLRFKNQLRDFDKYVQVDRDKGLGLTFSAAVLEDGDFVYITDSQPTRKKTVDDRARRADAEWIWRFEKKKECDRDRAFGVIFKTYFQDHLLTRIDFDPNIIEVIPPDFVVTMFKSMGNATINQIRRSATAEVTRKDLHGVPLPTLADIENVMGEPSKVETRKGRLVWTYVFNFYNPENAELSGQFKIAFRGDGSDLARQIDSFVVTGKAR